jgi:predicted Rossmann fold nucleotide-binding protein DprA/Smf involved in DNA uptake
MAHNEGTPSDSVGDVMAGNSTAAVYPLSGDVYPAPTEERRAAYFAAVEQSQQKVADLILERLIEEEQDPAQQPRRTLVEVAVETGLPIQLVQQVLWTLETRGDIRWEQGRFVVPAQHSARG